MTVSQLSPSVSFDGRSIPPSARETLWCAPDGHDIRRIDWSGAGDARCRGSLLFAPGRGDCYEKHLPALDAWHRQGWHVTAIDWRGQGMSGRLGLDPRTGHVADFSGWIEDFAAFWSQWRAAAPGPHVCVGHSMGGHLVLRAVAERRIAPDAIILVAPMLGLNPGWLPTALLHPLARIIAALGDPRRPAWKSNELPLLGQRARIALLTHDPVRYADEAWWYRERPDLVMGPASWGWIVAALASIRVLERRGLLEAVDIPALILGTSVDRLVSWPAIRRAAARLPDARLVAFGAEARHELLRESDPVRDRALAEIAAFLDRAAPVR